MEALRKFVAFESIVTIATKLEAAPSPDRDAHSGWPTSDFGKALKRWATFEIR